MEFSVVGEIDYVVNMMRRGVGVVYKFGWGFKKVFFEDIIFELNFDDGII